VVYVVTGRCGCVITPRVRAIMISQHHDVNTIKSKWIIIKK
jgi:hypothetical protein